MSLLRGSPCERRIYGSSYQQHQPSKRGQRQIRLNVSAAGGSERRSRRVRGKCFVTKDVSAQTLHTVHTIQHLFNQSKFAASVCWRVLKVAEILQNIDTDQIIPAEYLTLVPSKVSPSSRCFKPSSPHILQDMMPVSLTCRSACKHYPGRMESIANLSSCKKAVPASQQKL